MERGREGRRRLIEDGRDSASAQYTYLNVVQICSL